MVIESYHLNPSTHSLTNSPQELSAAIAEDKAEMLAVVEEMYCHYPNPNPNSDSDPAPRYDRRGWGVGAGGDQPPTPTVI